MTREELNRGSISTKEWSFLPGYGNEKLTLQLAAGLISKQISQSRLEDIQTVLAEACINAIEYGDGSSPIIVRLNHYSDRIEIEIINASEKEPKLPHTATAEQIWNKDCPRGWGLLIMHQLADQVHFSHSCEGFNVRMTYFVEGRSL